VVGGLLVDTVSWRAAFLINVPLVAVALWATWRHVAESRDDQASGHFDWLGAVVVALAVGGLAFGAIYGQQRDWKDPVGFIAIGVGVLATVALPILMSRSAHPLIPLGLFRSRNFAVTNLSTLVIYGALYVTSYYAALFQQGTLGYTATAAGVAGIPGTLLLIFFSARFGGLAARFGPRWFMAVGPALMAAGVLWLGRVPASSEPWRLTVSDPASLVPPVSYLVDFLPGWLLFGCGLTILVAPLTTALMTSIPVRNSGVGSAINNAISRVGPQLAGALIFVFITATFYSELAGRLPGVNVATEAFRARVSQLNTPADASMVSIARAASTDSFHIAMLVAGAMLLIGALVNAIGIQNAAAHGPAEEEAAGAPAAAAEPGAG